MASTSCFIIGTNGNGGEIARRRRQSSTETRAERAGKQVINESGFTGPLLNPCSPSAPLFPAASFFLPLRAPQWAFCLFARPTASVVQRKERRCTKRKRRERRSRDRRSPSAPRSAPDARQRHRNNAANKCL